MGRARWNALFGKLLIYLILVVGSAFIMLPLAWMVSTSLKSEGEIFLFPPRWIPSLIQWSNYAEALTILPFARFFRNSLIVTGTTLAGVVLSSSLVAFGFARLRFRGRAALFVVVLSSMIIPEQVTIIPRFLLYHRLHWIDTLLPLIVPAWFGAPFYIFLIRQYMMTIPRELDDAGRIDGCSTWQIFWRVVMPLTGPALAAAAIFHFIASWNDFINPLIFLNSLENYTVALGITFFKTSIGTYWNLMMAAAFVSLLPCILLFLFMQKYLVQGNVLSGLRR